MFVNIPKPIVYNKNVWWHETLDLIKVFKSNVSFHEIFKLDGNHFPLTPIDRTFHIMSCNIFISIMYCYILISNTNQTKQMAKTKKGPIRSNLEKHLHKAHLAFAYPRNTFYEYFRFDDHQNNSFMYINFIFSLRTVYEFH